MEGRGGGEAQGVADPKKTNFVVAFSTLFPSDRKVPKTKK
jgi:hypothetical protein